MLLALVFLTFVKQVTAQESKHEGSAQPDFSAAEIEFFEYKVRPLLVEHCLQCHGDDEKKIRGGLRLTSRAEILSGGDSGPAAVSGKPKESLLIASVHYEEFEMPPKGQLKDTDIETLTRWVKLGLPDPRQSGKTPTTNVIDIVKGKEYWAFKKANVVTPPEIKDGNWPDSKIDEFILSRLEAESIRPVGDANRETLIRRATLALTGLPATVEQIEQFESDPGETKIAFAKIVDEQLASPHFGERWGRHWLDVTRFAESSGGGRSLMFPHAWRFRDYVIDAYNNDKPFDEFIKEQIAGDLMPFESHDQKIERIVATGFLALGPTNYEQQDKELLRMEVIDEQVDTIGRAFLGLTLGCARCHDHKFDPIPMTDYYAMAGILKSTRSLVDGNVSKYVERPLATDEEIAIEKTYKAKVAKLSRQLNTAKKKLAQLNGQEKTYADLAKKNRLSKNLEGIVWDSETAQLVGRWKKSTSVGLFVDGHYIHDDNEKKGEKQVVFSPKFETGGQYEVRLSYSSDGNRASNVPVTINHQDGLASLNVNQSEAPPIDGLFISLGTFRFEADNKSTVTISNKGTDGYVMVDAVQFIKKVESVKDADDKSKATDLNTDSKDASKIKEAEKAGNSAIANKAVADKAKSAEVVELESKIKSLNKRLKKLKKTRPVKLAIAMSVEEAKTPADGHLHIRGSVRNLGPVIPRGFISVCCDESPQPKLEKHESGRLQLAQWIADRNHPLTARVYVNRIWRQLFGKGLVRTTDNFGAMGERPSHPALLDYLAEDFVANGWSTKRLIRKIMLSHVFRLSAEQNEAGNERDDQNRLLWRADRRRIDAEVLRDSILFVSGDLDLKPGGLTINKITEFDFGYKFDTVRRSVYVPSFRNSMLDLFEVFDFADPNLVVGNRNTSTLPTQALFLMNSPMVIKQSENAAKRLLQRKDLDARSRIEYAYRQTIGRRPTKAEIDSAVSYIQSFAERESEVKQSELAAWTSFCHALFASLEFRYVD